MAPPSSTYAALPLELVLQIIQYLVSDSANKLQAVLRIAQLNVSTWALVLGTASFWDTIEIRTTVNSVKFAETCLTRSKDLPLKISVAQGRDVAPTQASFRSLRTLLSKSAHRIVTLNVNLGVPNRLYSLFKRLNSLAMPLLEVLNVENWSSGEAEAEANPTRVELVSAPQLRSLTVAGVYPVTLAGSNERLSTLRIDANHGFTWFFNQVTQVVNQFSGLQHLTLNGEPGGSLKPESTIEFFPECPNLLTLALLYLDNEFVVDFLGALDAPNLKVIHFTPPDDNGGEPLEDDHHWDALGILFDTVERLVIHENRANWFPVTWKFVTFLMTTFPNVRHLQLSLGSTDFLEICQQVGKWLMEWPLLETMEIVDEDPLGPQIQDKWDFYRHWLQIILAFVHRREEKLKALKIYTLMEVETDWGRMLVDQLTKDVEDVEFIPEVFGETAQSRACAS